MEIRAEDISGIPGTAFSGGRRHRLSDVFRSVFGSAWKMADVEFRRAGRMSEERSRTIKFRVSPEEYARIEELRKRSRHATTSGFMRASVLDNASDRLDDLATQFGKIFATLNDFYAQHPRWMTARLRREIIEELERSVTQVRALGARD